MNVHRCTSFFVRQHQTRIAYGRHYGECHRPHSKKDAAVKRHADILLRRQLAAKNRRCRVPVAERNHAQIVMEIFNVFWWYSDERVQADGLEHVIGCRRRHWLRVGPYWVVAARKTQAGRLTGETWPIEEVNSDLSRLLQGSLTFLFIRLLLSQGVARELLLC